MSDNNSESHILGRYDQFDWNTHEKEAIQAAILDGKIMNLASFHDLIQTDSVTLKCKTRLIGIAEGDIQFLNLKIIGVININPRDAWFFLEPNNDMYEGADAINVVFEDPVSADDIPKITDVDQDNWHIISKEPLLLRSMYGSILGFKKKAEHVECHVINEGDPGW